MSLLRPHTALRKGREAHRERFDYSETRLSANALGKTAPKLVSLPKSPRTNLAPRLASPGKVGIRPGQPVSEAVAAGE